MQENLHAPIWGYSYSFPGLHTVVLLGQYRCLDGTVQATQQLGDQSQQGDDEPSARMHPRGSAALLVLVTFQHGAEVGSTD
jgi:hypothetical protein